MYIFFVDSCCDLSQVIFVTGPGDWYDLSQVITLTGPNLSQVITVTDPGDWYDLSQVINVIGPYEGVTGGTSLQNLIETSSEEFARVVYLSKTMFTSFEYKKQVREHLFIKLNQAGEFKLSNSGMVGVDRFNAILPPIQVNDIATPLGKRGKLEDKRSRAVAGGCDKGCKFTDKKHQVARKCLPARMAANIFKEILSKLMSDCMAVDKRMEQQLDCGIRIGVFAGLSLMKDLWDGWNVMMFDTASFLEEMSLARAMGIEVTA
ncbi:hypothetical protein C5167_006035 [Papaver somniferum]|uniref:Uncharacterized protein n=1 Tax=Papaver somniferum TaxID=3469 RepID=A0A4Y7JFM8_PAPSO|nr:hypothetical protein C5167_006035 [Papaver somniferum]